MLSSGAMSRSRILPIAALLLAAAAATGLRLRATSHYFATQRYEDLYYLPPAEWLGAFSLGYREAAADFVWMRALVYYGEGIAHQQMMRNVLAYAEAVTTLDPDFEAVYHWSSTAVAYQTTAAPVEDLEAVGRLLEQGVARFPESGEMAWNAGSFWAFELGMRYPPSSAERRAAEARGSEFLTRAARLGAGPAWLALSNASQLVRLGERERAIQHLEEMFALTDDDEVREEIAGRIASLRSEADREVMERTLREAERNWRADYPYLSPMLYELVGPRRLLDSLLAGE